jgi:ABC-type uncharacterized transport system permease subunit
MRISLRGLLIATALVAIVIGSLRYTNEAWLAVVIGVTMALLFWALIVAAVDRGPRQAFALAFALTMMAYGIALVSGYRVTGTSGSVMSRSSIIGKAGCRRPESCDSSIKQWIAATGYKFPKSCSAAIPTDWCIHCS